jgi:hypothetical protein
VEHLSNITQYTLSLTCAPSCPPPSRDEHYVTANDRKDYAPAYRQPILLELLVSRVTRQPMWMAKDCRSLRNHCHGSVDAECYRHESLLTDRQSQEKGSRCFLRSLDRRSREAPTLINSCAEDQLRHRAIVDRQPYTLPAKQRDMPRPAWNPARGLTTIPSQQQNTENGNPSCILPTQVREKEDATMSTEQQLSCG